ncbi:MULTISPECIES: CHAT domain-containing protein [Kamptonema]|uniref:CHAT domain-containing protein n=1 Tax=Kamptonema TaxID=1501433 RepID=UPI0001DAC6FC|nr:MULTISPECIES: CHAT domain-containing tetratricopeptide repeat protein [Kamptonema]CBN56777.1 TPR repeat-containing protein [Kamptonema sp. PCC 6506]
MDQLRRQAYLNLIELLLNCPNGEEKQILQANSELVDAGLVQVMLERANNLRTDNYLDDANSLMTLAGHLMGSYGNTMVEKLSPSIYLKFLTEVLQVTLKGKGDPNVIYPLLRDNLNLVNDNLAVALRNWARETLPHSDSQEIRISIIEVVGNFCNAIRQFPLGSRASNLEIAIAGYEVALTVFTRQEYSKDWAATQNNLAITYNNRIRGERADNLEMAISAYREALSVDTRETYPEDWAMTQNNLGTAYDQRIRGEQAQNLELAIAAYLASLEIRTREKFPEEWAMTQNNLGNAYRNRIKGKTDDNIELAIAAFEKALEVYTCDTFPKDWARCQNNLGLAYSNRIRGEKADNLEMAISAYHKTLSVYTREAFPEDWAITQNNLANAYSGRIRGEKTDNLKIAISALQAALSVSTREAFPINHAKTLYNLGLAYRNNSQLPEAYNTLNTAIETVESMRTEIIRGGEADRQKLAEEYNRISHIMVEVCLEMQNKTAALEYIERSKTRNLVELFYNARSVQKNGQPISCQEIRTLLGEDEAILEWYITFNGFKVFIITSNSTQPDIWHSSDQDLDALEEFQQEYINEYIYQRDNWKKQLETRLKKLAEILHIDEIISRLPENCQRLILVPFRYLHLLPLHALTSRRLRQNVEETGCLLDLFPGGVRYTPSCQILQLSQRVNPTGEESSPTRLFAIQNPPTQNPKDDLPFADIEVEAIEKAFNYAKVLIREKATKAALQEQIKGLQNPYIAHFACHGRFNFTNPRKSALILARVKRATDNVNLDDITDLTLEEIFNLPLSKCSLVTLSACETGLTDIRDTTDEYIGLPSGFLSAGATSVISTLWVVDDVSTAILMIKFYELLLSESRSPVAIALRESQLWLRGASVQDLLDWADSSKLLDSQNRKRIKKRLRGYKPEFQSFQDPLFWAAFCAVGQ